MGKMARVFIKLEKGILLVLNEAEYINGIKRGKGVRRWLSMKKRERGTEPKLPVKKGHTIGWLPSPNNQTNVHSNIKENHNVSHNQ
jgi:hypothetical protein